MNFLMLPTPVLECLSSSYMESLTNDLSIIHRNFWLDSKDPPWRFEYFSDTLGYWFCDFNFDHKYGSNTIVKISFLNSWVIQLRLRISLFKVHGYNLQKPYELEFITGLLYVIQVVYKNQGSRFQKLKHIRVYAISDRSSGDWELSKIFFWSIKKQSNVCQNLDFNWSNGSQNTDRTSSLSCIITLWAWTCITQSLIITLSWNLPI